MAPQPRFRVENRVSRDVITGKVYCTSFSPSNQICVVMSNV